jgi:ankyrin repeat protein
MTAADEICELIEDDSSIDLIEKRIRESNGQLDRKSHVDSPIHVAARQGRIDVISILLDGGSSIDLAGDLGDTALHIAAHRGDKEMVQMLAERGARFDQENLVGFTPLFVAARRGEREIANLLIEHGAPPELHAAVCLGWVDSVRVLVEANPSVIATARWKNDLLPDAIYSGNRDMVEVVLGWPDVDVNAYGLSGQPPIIAAVASSDYDLEIVEMLLKYGAQVEVRSASGGSIWDIAKKYHSLRNDDRLLRLLESWQ